MSNAVSRDDMFDVQVRELRHGEPLWRDEPEKIGAFAERQTLVSVALPPDTFNHFWAAAEANYSAAPYIEIVLKPGTRADDSRSPIVINVGLIESMASKIHPVVAEVRAKGEKLNRILHGAIYVGVAVFAIAAAAKWLGF